MDELAPATRVPIEERWSRPVSGPAYRASARVATVLMLLGLAGYAARVLASAPPIPAPMLMLFAAAGAVALVSGWYIVTGRTTIDARGVRQDWLWQKAYGWHEIARAKHLRLPFTSRLLILTGRGPMRAIHSGSRELDAAFREIDAWYAAR